MTKNFWKKFNKPIIALAPMAGITDTSFRYLCGKSGADVVYSEMVSATALVYDSEKTLELMKSYKNNGGAKFVVQLFGNKPEHFAQAVKLIEKKIKPDGIDINFGCPVAKIVKSGAGSALFQDLDLAHEVIKACINNTSLPISIKTRISVNKSGINPPRSRLSGSTPTEEGNLTVDIFQFLERMKDLDIKAIMVHGRTLAQGFNGEIDFEVIKKVKEIFKGIVIANGGIKNYLEAQEAIERTGADGVGIGQGACGRPWIFIELKKNKEIKISKKEALTMAFKHAKLMQKLKGDAGIREMRKHLCWYVKSLSGASELRQKFVQVEKLLDIKKLVK